MSRESNEHQPLLADDKAPPDPPVPPKAGRTDLIQNAGQDSEAKTKDGDGGPGTKGLGRGTEIRGK